VLDRVSRRDRFSMKKPLCSSAKGASFHIKHASNANVVRVVSLDATRIWHSEINTQPQSVPVSQQRTLPCETNV
jgi:hypothetical protein